MPPMPVRCSSRIIASGSRRRADASASCPSCALTTTYPWLTSTLSSERLAHSPSVAITMTGGWISASCIVDRCRGGTTEVLRECRDTTLLYECTLRRVLHVPFKRLAEPLSDSVRRLVLQLLLDFRDVRPRPA